MARDQQAGVVKTMGDEITYLRGKAEWTLRLDAIAVIGEATNQSGPWGVDHILCIVTDRGARWYEVPSSATGADDLLGWLGKKLSATLDWKLVTSTDFTSQVLWPAVLRGQLLFEFVEPVPKSLPQRLAKAVGLWPLSNEQRVHPSIVEAIRSAPTWPPHAA